MRPGREAPNPQVIAEFRSIERIDPATVAISPDRLELSGGGRREARVVPLEEVERVKVRTLLGVSTILIRTSEGPTLVADLFAREEAVAAQALLEDLIAATPASVDAAAAPAA